MNCFLATTNWLASVLAAVCLALALVAVPVGSVKADDPSPTPGEVEIGGNCYYKTSNCTSHYCPPFLGLCCYDSVSTTAQ